MKVLILLVALLFASPAFGQGKSQAARANLKALPEAAQSGLSQKHQDQVLEDIVMNLKTLARLEAQVKMHNALLKALEANPQLKADLLSEE